MPLWTKKGVGFTMMKITINKPNLKIEMKLRNL